MRLRNRIRTRLGHYSTIDRLHRARCDCGWVGPVRECSVIADEDRSDHIRQATRHARTPK